ncbi:tetratricopeptide repeat protein [Pelodictyon luteolum]|uniref:Regulator of microtubule dynamics protein 1 n=1 Tax=Chlorobium luteolum (strain DSM 273 / BCRC 81028 / 2530) TaxID=319225 RepID=Q3B4D6_CHLL3|nr:hypothetical protein [Pelodictyon luteolum]ABB23795.1 conserved hypothetical protein [Pelodictyon luteolum DSM 273]
MKHYTPTLRLLRTLALGAIVTSLSAIGGTPCAMGETQALHAINEGDRAFWKMQYESADSLYGIALKEDPASAETRWKMARLQVSLAESLRPDRRRERIVHYRKAVDYGRQSIALDSTSAPGHAWLAAALGLLSEKSGPKDKLHNAEEIKHELDTALRLNPNEQTALSMLGSYYRQAASISWFKRMMGGTFVGKMPKGSYLEARETFRKAITLDPRVIRNYHELALVELEMGNRKKAVQLMQAALDKPVLFYSDRRRLQKMRRLIEKLKDD